MNADAVRYLFDQILDLPEDGQAELMDMLIDARAQQLGIYHLDDDDRDALARSDDDIRNGRFASDTEVAATFARYGA